MLGNGLGTPIVFFGFVEAIRKIADAAEIGEHAGQAALIGRLLRKAFGQLGPDFPGLSERRLRGERSVQRPIHQAPCG